MACVLLAAVNIKPSKGTCMYISKCRRVLKDHNVQVSLHVHVIVRIKKIKHISKQHIAPVLYCTVKPPSQNLIKYLGHSRVKNIRDWFFLKILK